MPPGVCHGRLQCRPSRVRFLRLIRLPVAALVRGLSCRRPARQPRRTFGAYVCLCRRRGVVLLCRPLVFLRPVPCSHPRLLQLHDARRTAFPSRLPTQTLSAFAIRPPVPHLQRPQLLRRLQRPPPNLPRSRAASVSIAYCVVLSQKARSYVLVAKSQGCRNRFRMRHEVKKNSYI